MLKSDSVFALDTDIRFIIPVTDYRPEDTTFFQGFSQSLCENAHLFRLAAFFPSNVYDFSEQNIEAFQARRISGINSINIFPQTPRSIKFIPLPVFAPFTIILMGKDQSPNDYKDWIEASEVPATIVADKNGDISYEDFQLQSLQEHFLKLCDKIP